MHSSEADHLLRRKKNPAAKPKPARSAKEIRLAKKRKIKNPSWRLRRASGRKEPKTSPEREKIKRISTRSAKESAEDKRSRGVQTASYRFDKGADESI